MRVNEIFRSIQGEGVHQGIPMVFIRLAGCNLIPHCLYCDTSYSWKPENGTEESLDSIISEVWSLQPYSKSWVCITGGEPLWQDIEGLVRRLKQEGYLITVETNGSFNIPSWYTLVDSWNPDIKCPSSGVCGTSKESWFNTRNCDQIKFVVGNKGDLDFTSKIINKHRMDSPVVLVSPVINLLKLKEPIEDYLLNAKWLEEVVEFCKDEKVRFSLQWHKVIWGNKKGV